jgi:hypothetical protein
MRKWGPEYLAICGLAKYFPVMNSESHVFFVDDGVGNDGVNTGGQLPDEPFLTITKALSECTSAKNDFIFILNYYQATGETWPISISKGQVHIIGIGYTSGPWNWVQPTGDTAAFSLTSGSDGVEIAGLEIGAGATHAGIEIVTGGIWNVHIHDCGFGTEHGMTAKHGIRCTGGSTPTIGEMINWLIDNNRFGIKLTASGIEVPTTFVGPNNVKGTIIRDNIFRVVDNGQGINVPLTTADFKDGGIFDNKFIVEGDDDGAAVLFGTGTKGMVDGNQAVYKDESTICAVATGNLFLTGTDGMSWGRNYLSATLLAIETDYTT